MDGLAPLGRDRNGAVAGTNAARRRTVSKALASVTLGDPERNTEPTATSRRAIIMPA
jgi:hypothetical protein